MKKKILIIVAITIVLAILFIPTSSNMYEDGGTKEYNALAYKVVKWKRMTDSNDYIKTRVYFFPYNLKSIDELWEEEGKNVEYKLVATILEINDSTVVAERAADNAVYLSNDKVAFDISGLKKINAKVGNVIEVTHKGDVIRSYPEKLNAISWRLLSDVHQVKYTEQWLDKTVAEKCDYELFEHIEITKIYSNCFFAKSVTPRPYEIKLNGTLSDKWCVGDYVTCYYENTYYDRENQRVECDFTQIYESDWQPEKKCDR